MRRLGIVAVGLALVVALPLLAACASDKVVEKIVVVTPTVAPTSTPEPKPAITVDDAALYLDVSDVLPGFERLDPRQEGMTKEQVWGQWVERTEQFSDFDLYLSEQPFQYVFMAMAVFPSKMELAAWKASMRKDDEALTQDFISGLTESLAASTGLEEAPSTSVVWSDLAVGDSAKRAEVLMSYEGGEPLQLDFVLLFQENSVVFIYNMWYPTEPPTVDILTVTRAVSARIANR